jgi:hypothetical protein
MKFNTEINTAITGNLKVKSGILSVIFSAILFLQLGVIFFTELFDDLLKSFENKLIVVYGPGMLLLAALCEIYAFRYIRGVIRKKQYLSPLMAYLIAFIEVSFPSAIILFISIVLKGSDGFTIIDLFNSPPVTLYFIMIMLSSLMLDYKISLFAGIIGAAEFLLLSNYLLSNYPDASNLDWINVNVKALFIFISGSIAAFISYKTREAVISSLQSKDDLINKLDQMVHLKTEEIRNQKAEIEEKNKDLLDSINYARRIQHSQMPTETYIQRVLRRLRK